jgi:hypothetical protein
VNAGDPREGDMWTALFYCCAPPPAAGFFFNKLYCRQQVFFPFLFTAALRRRQQDRTHTAGGLSIGSRIFLLLLHLPAGSAAKYHVLINK